MYSAMVKSPLSVGFDYCVKFGGENPVTFGAEFGFGVGYVRFCHFELKSVITHHCQESKASWIQLSCGGQDGCEQEESISFHTKIYKTRKTTE